MKERIRELAEQAGLAEAADVRGGFIYPPGMEKFARLIVRECMGLLPEDCQSDNGCHAYWTLKEHFGVEE
jgi:hypothetical protein